MTPEPSQKTLQWSRPSKARTGPHEDFSFLEMTMSSCRDMSGALRNWSGFMMHTGACCILTRRSSLESHAGGLVDWQLKYCWEMTGS